MTLEQLRQREAELTLQIAALNADRAKVRVAIANLEVPFKAGDTVKGVHGTYRISRIGVYGGISTAYGHKIKKNGEPGLRETRLYGIANKDYDWKLVS